MAPIFILSRYTTTLFEIPINSINSIMVVYALSSIITLGMIYQPHFIFWLEVLDKKSCGVVAKRMVAIRLKKKKTKHVIIEANLTFFSNLNTL